MKLFLLFVILAIGLCIAMAEDFNWGTQGSGDRLLEKRTVQKDWELFPVKETLRFPPKPKTYDVPITAIKVVDKIKNSANRDARLAGGGVGQNFVDLTFYAEGLRGYDYDVFIYGRN